MLYPAELEARTRDAGSALNRPAMHAGQVLELASSANVDDEGPMLSGDLCSLALHAPHPTSVRVGGPRRLAGTGSGGRAQDRRPAPGDFSRTSATRIEQILLTTDALRR